MDHKTPSSKPSARAAGIRPSWKVTSFLCIALIAGCFFAARFLQSSDDATQLSLPVITNGPDSNPDAFDSDGLPNASTQLDPAAAQALTDEEWAKLPLTQRITQQRIDAAEHPFDPLLKVARGCLEKIDREVADYTATITSQVRIDGVLQPARKMQCKIRHPNEAPEDKSTFSVYTRFIKPDSLAGQEAIWVDGWHEGNLIAHTTGFKNLFRIYLEPTSSLAMSGSLHPIYDIGFRNLIVKMCEVGERDRQHGECEVTVSKGLELGGRKCILLQVTHPVKRDHFESHIARIYIDLETEYPLAYEGYLWPETEGGDPVLLEKYFYSDIQFNVGLKDIDFDPANEAYDYPSR